MAFVKPAGEGPVTASLVYTDRSAYRPLETTLRIIAVLRRLYPTNFQFHNSYFDKIMGTASVRAALEKGTDVGTIVEGWKAGLASFEEMRKPYLLY